MPAKKQELSTGPPIKCLVKQIDGLAVYADVHLPSRIPSKGAADVLLYIHGGAFCAMDSTDIPAFLLRWSQRTEAVIVSANYRLAPQAKLAEIVTDVQDCLNWVVDGRLATEVPLPLTGSVAVLGGSAGGWLSLLLASLCYPSVKVAAAIYPMTNVHDDHYRKPWSTPAVVQLSTIQPYLDQPVTAGAEPDFDYTTGAISGRHNVAIYMAQNALWQSWLLGDEKEAFDVRRKVTPQWPPIFLLHGAEDVTILPSNSDDMALALKRAEVQHSLMKIPNAAHFFDILASEEQEDTLGLTALMQFVDSRL